jgi:hypothetical protein
MRYQMIPSPTDRCAILLDQAWYCESCQAICNDATCCICASEDHTQFLAPWLDREREPIRVPSTGVFLTVIPTAKERTEEADWIAPLAVPPRAA